MPSSKTDSPATTEKNYSGSETSFLRDFLRTKDALYVRDATVADKAKILAAMGWVAPKGEEEQGVGDVEAAFAATKERLAIKNHPTILQSRDVFGAMGWQPPGRAGASRDEVAFRPPKPRALGFSWSGGAVEDDSILEVDT